jgi:hypothetical protein
MELTFKELGLKKSNKDFCFAEETRFETGPVNIHRTGSTKSPTTIFVLRKKLVSNQDQLIFTELEVQKVQQIFLFCGRNSFRTRTTPPQQHIKQ